MTAVIEVERFGSLAVVTRDGVEVWGPGPIAQAENKRDTLERQARRKRRKCMTCSDPFMSEGAHNRMCNPCRARTSADTRSYSFAPRASRRSISR
ncbi:hypothetical protein OL67_000585 [Phaeobacter piscinae]|nr:hypothetical protein OL67_000585 [Phaeobacter piscinae]